MVRPDDDEPTADELREAEELARLLDGDDVGDRAFDARTNELEAASLLRYSSGAGELPPEREQAILADILADADRAAAAASAPKAAAAPARAAGDAAGRGLDWGRALRWFFGVGGLAAAAAVALLVVRPWRPDGGDVATRLPAPTVELLRAQASAASEGGSLAGLSDAMRGYRSRVFDALSSRYGSAQSAEVVVEQHQQVAFAMCDGTWVAPSSELRTDGVAIAPGGSSGLRGGPSGLRVRGAVSRPRSRPRPRPAIAHAYVYVERFAK